VFVVPELQSVAVKVVVAAAVTVVDPELQGQVL
jgi:hypothetical protein